MTDIAGRVAFITGGANGIGRGIARAFARKGAKLALVDLDLEALDETRRELAEMASVETAVLDVRDRGSFARIADDFENALGPISIVVNNAGVAGGAPAEKLTYELWDWGMGINLEGVINGVQTFLPRIIAREVGGHIVNTASVAGIVAGNSGVLYDTAKAAVVGLSESLRVELEPKGVGVTLLCPGPVATGIVDRTRASQPKVTHRMSPEERSKAFARNEAYLELLAQGASPDAVGEMVLDAVLANQLYVFTCDMAAAGTVARSQALLEAMSATRS